MPPNILFAFADDWGRYASAYRPFEGENAINALIDTRISTGLPRAEAPSWDSLLASSRPAYSDMDGGPTKAWMIHHRADEDVQPLFEIGFGKRPREELYDLRVDPHYMNNVATNPDYEQIRKDLANELMGILRERRPTPGGVSLSLRADPLRGSAGGRRTPGGNRTANKSGPVGTHPEC